MNFTSVVEAVISLTKRPDKRTETERAVNSALSFFCLKESFPQDMIEATLSIDPTLYGDTISIASLARLRKFAYVKPTGLKGYMMETSPEHLFTPGGLVQLNRYYRAGTFLTYTLRTLTNSLEVGYYVYPATLTGNDTHWMLDMEPHAVIDKAAATIFKSTGDDKSFQIHEALATQMYDVLVRDLCH